MRRAVLGGYGALALVSAVVLSAALGYLLASRVGAVVVTHAYNGTSGVDALDYFFRNQPPRPLARYLEYWRELVRVLTVLWAGLGVLGVLLSRPGFQNLWERWQGHTVEVVPRLILGPRRFILVRGVIVFCLVLASLNIVLDVEFWPFSNYPMYSDVSEFDPDIPAAMLLLYGVRDSVGEPERRLEEHDLWPFNYRRMQDSLSGLLRNHNERPGDYLDDVLEGVLQRLNSTRQQGDSEYVGVRLYWVRWDRNDFETLERDRPDSRYLLWAFPRDVK